MSFTGKSRPIDPTSPPDPSNDVSDSTDRRSIDGAGAAQSRSRPLDIPRTLAPSDDDEDHVAPPPRLVKERPPSPARSSPAYGHRHHSPPGRSDDDGDGYGDDDSDSDGAAWDSDRGPGRRGRPPGPRRSHDDRTPSAPARRPREEDDASPLPSPMSSPHRPDDVNDDYEDRGRDDRRDRRRSRSPDSRGRHGAPFDSRYGPRSPSPSRSRRRHYNPGSPPPRRCDDSRSPPPQRRRGVRGGGRARARRGFRSRSPPPRRGGVDDDFGARRGRKRPHPDGPPSTEDELARRSCTVFLRGLPPNVTDDDVIAPFRAAGAVADVQLINAPRTRRPMGYGFVEFEDAVAMPAALALNKSAMQGHVIEVQMPPLDSKQPQSGRSAAAVAAPGPLAAATAVPPVPGARVHVANLPTDASEADLMSLFQLFGNVMAVTIPRGNGNRINYCFVQFETPEQAARAIAEGVQLPFRGRELRVSPVKEHKPLAPSGPFQVGARVPPPPFFVGVGLGPGMGMGFAPGGLLPGVGALPFFPPGGGGVLAPANSPAGVTPLDDGVSLDARSRAALMSKLALAPNAVAAPPAPTLPPEPSSSRPTRTLLLSPMFSERESVQEPVLRDIESDCRAECAKFGHVLRVHAVRGSAGHVAVEFVAVSSAVAALGALQGRFFAGQKLVAAFVADADFPI